MHILLFLFLLVVFPLNADPKDPYSLAVTEGEPAALVGGCVSAITGDLYLEETDVLVQGYVPLRLPRQYLSGDGRGTLAGWSFINHLEITYKGGEHDHKVTIQEPNGSTFIFKCPADEVHGHFRKKKHPPKFRPPAEGETPGLTSQGGKSNLKNASIRLEEHGKYLTVYCADQTARRYKVHHKAKHFKDVFKGEESKKIKYLLESETLHSGHKVIYKYDHEDRLEKIRTTNPSESKTYASAEFHYHHKHKEKIPNVDITLSDGRVLSYRYEEKEEDVFLLRSVTSPESPEESIFYHGRAKHSGNLVSRITLPNLRFQDIDYYCEGPNDIYGVNVKVKDKHDPKFLRVKTLKSPVSADSSPQPTHRFFYCPELRHTDVRAIDNTLTRYHYSPSMRLDSILHFDHGDVLSHKESFKWTGGGDLLLRSFEDAQGNVLFSRLFRHDERGNILLEELRGNLTGKANSIDSYAIKRTYSQDGRDLLLIEEEQNDKVTHYVYLPNSNLLAAKFLCEGALVKVRTFYDYNEDCVLIRETQDDGSSVYRNNQSNVTTRKTKIIIPMPSGPYVDMPQIVEERYWNGSSEALLQKTVLHYTTGGRVSLREVYDALGVHRYNLRYTYDSLGRLDSETNPIGQTATYSYDPAGQRKTQTPFSGRRKIAMNHDFCNRLNIVHETGFEGVSRFSRYEYDFKHNKIVDTDPFENQTRHAYNTFGHKIKTDLSSVLDEDDNVAFPSFSFTSDSAGRETSRTDPKGYTTHKSYNARSQVTHIRHPDGAQEHFFYNLDGTLSANIDAEGHATTHTYDAFGRCTSTKDPLGNLTTYFYDSFHLLAIQDPEGYITKYTYDGASRKIAEEKNGERIEYAYDEMGNVCYVKTGSLFTLMEYDLLGRVTEERLQDDQGKTLSQTAYEYDAAGNKNVITRNVRGQEVKETFEYDSLDRLIFHTDPLGNQTHINYDELFRNSLGQRVLQKVTTDPLGQKTLETYDSHRRLVSTEIQSSCGSTCSLEEFKYDLSGNMTSQISTIYPQMSKIETSWKYDNRDRLIALIEPQGKKTCYSYTPKGLLQDILKPDGVNLHRDYDANGNLIQLFSSDGSIYYKFKYNRLGQFTVSVDQITGNATVRIPDPQGRLLAEKLANNLNLIHDYDFQGRRISLMLPDGSDITYDYDALHLKEVTRKDSSGNRLYTHRYREHDLSGNLLSQELIYNLGEVTYSISPHGKTAAIHSSYFSQNVTRYDPVRNILTLETGSQATNYSYDDLYQLIEEDGAFSHTYVCDSHYNRLQKDDEKYKFDDLNQLVTAVYDKNGNVKSSKGVLCSYDALDRLICVETPTRKLVFSYDSFHRRLSKTIYERSEDNWNAIDQHLYFYDCQHEIGATDQTGKIIQLRILGATPHAEIGAAVAIELNGQVYAPIHDLFGNVTTLISKDGTVSQRYSYDSFGNHTSSTNLENPWKFASKRQEETGHIYFGRRYYDPATGRWTTPDPIGFPAGISLYAFVQNNPLVNLDLYGLSVHNASPPISVSTPIVVTPMFFPPQVSPKELAISPSLAPKVKSHRGGSSRRSAPKNFSVGLLEGAGHCGIALTGGIAGVGQLIAAPFYFLSGQWDTWGEHWNNLGNSNSYYHHSWQQQMLNLLPIEQRLPYYSHIAATAQSIGEGVLLGATVGPTMLTRGMQLAASYKAPQPLVKTYDIIHVTPQGVAIPYDLKYQIPKRYIENKFRSGSYGELINGSFQEKLRIDPATMPGKKGPNYSHYHLNNTGTHYSPRLNDPNPGFEP